MKINIGNVCVCGVCGEPPVFHKVIHKDVSTPWSVEIWVSLCDKHEDLLKRITDEWFEFVDKSLHINGLTKDEYMKKEKL